MIINPESVVNKYSCNKMMGMYLVYSKHVPLLSVVGDRYYFANTFELREILDNLPFYMKIFDF